MNFTVIKRSIIKIKTNYNFLYAFVSLESVSKLIISHILWELIMVFMTVLLIFHPCDMKLFNV